MNAVTPAGRLDRETAEALEAGRPLDAFTRAGTARQQGGAASSGVFLPGAQAVEVIGRDDGRSWGDADARRLPPASSKDPSSDPAPTCCASSGPALCRRRRTPMPSGRLLGDLDLHLFNEGRHFELAEALGANCLVDGRRGGRTLRGLGAERPARRGDRRFQLLGPAAPSDAPAALGGRLGDVHPAPAAPERATSSTSSGRAAMAPARQGGPAGAAGRTGARAPPRSSPPPPGLRLERRGAGWPAVPSARHADGADLHLRGPCRPGCARRTAPEQGTDRSGISADRG